MIWIECEISRLRASIHIYFGVSKRFKDEITAVEATIIQISWSPFWEIEITCTPTEENKSNQIKSINVTPSETKLCVCVWFFSSQKAKNRNFILFWISETCKVLEVNYNSKYPLKSYFSQ